MITSNYTISQRQCGSELWNWRDSCQQILPADGSFFLGLIWVFWGEILEEKELLEAGNDCKETNERSCLNWTDASEMLCVIAA